MSAFPNNGDDHRISPGRAEQIALAGLGMQAIFSLFTLGLAFASNSQAVWLITIQMSIGILFWILTYVHLRLRRGAREESYDLQQAEERRRQQGVTALFEEEQEGRAARNLSHMETYVAPAASLLLALLLLAPTLNLIGQWLFEGTSLVITLRSMPQIEADYTLVVAAFGICMSLAMFLLGNFASGLSRERVCALLRAGSGYMLSSALFLFIAALALALTNRGWLGAWPDKVVAIIVFVWLVFQGVEMVVNFTLDFYRPRIAGVDARPVYDSRLSGILAEPQGIFRTFAHTMDYQFGFKVSETWFFRFLERALAPLILIQLFTLYLLTCFVVVQPGEVAVIERWGAPRGFKALPEEDGDWDRLPQPLGADAGEGEQLGIYLKWPWPVEVARVVKRDEVLTMHTGFKATNATEAAEKARELYAKTVSWDEEHMDKEHQYLMPLPRDMRSEGPDSAAADAAAAPPVHTSADPKETDKVAPQNTLLLSGTFTLEYGIGTRPGDVYRYIYRFRDEYDYETQRRVSDGVRILQALLDREITAYLAGADFWDMMICKGDKAHKAIVERLRRAVAEKHLGIQVLGLHIQNVHPPVGDVGKAYQEVLSARQKVKEKIYDAEIERSKILGLVPSQKKQRIADAKAYKKRRALVSQAMAERFLSQVAADRAAPQVYRARQRMQTIEEALKGRHLVIHPPDIEVRIDRSRLPSVLEETIESGTLRQEP